MRNRFFLSLLFSFLLFFQSNMLHADIVPGWIDLSELLNKNEQVPPADLLLIKSEKGESFYVVIVNPDRHRRAINSPKAYLVKIPSGKISDAEILDQVDLFDLPNIKSLSGVQPKIARASADPIEGYMLYTLNRETVGLSFSVDSDNRLQVDALRLVKDIRPFCNLSEYRNSNRVSADRFPMRSVSGPHSEELAVGNNQVFLISPGNSPRRPASIQKAPYKIDEEAIRIGLLPRIYGIDRHCPDLVQSENDTYYLVSGSAALEMIQPELDDYGSYIFMGGGINSSGNVVLAFFLRDVGRLLLVEVDGQEGKMVRKTVTSGDNRIINRQYLHSAATGYAPYTSNQDLVAGYADYRSGELFLLNADGVLRWKDVWSGEKPEFRTIDGGIRASRGGAALLEWANEKAWLRDGRGNITALDWKNGNTQVLLEESHNVRNISVHPSSDEYGFWLLHKGSRGGALYSKQVIEKPLTSCSHDDADKLLNVKEDIYSPSAETLEQIPAESHDQNATRSASAGAKMPVAEVEPLASFPFSSRFKYAAHLILAQTKDQDIDWNDLEPAFYASFSHKRYDTNWMLWNDKGEFIHELPIMSDTIADGAIALKTGIEGLFLITLKPRTHHRDIHHSQKDKSGTETVFYNINTETIHTLNETIPENDIMYISLCDVKDFTNNGKYEFLFQYHPRGALRRVALITLKQSADGGYAPRLLADMEAPRSCNLFVESNGLVQFDPEYHILYSLERSDFPDSDGRTYSEYKEDQAIRQNNWIKAHKLKIIPLEQSYEERAARIQWGERFNDIEERPIVPVRDFAVNTLVEGDNTGMVRIVGSHFERLKLPLNARQRARLDNVTSTIGRGRDFNCSMGPVGDIYLCGGVPASAEGESGHALEGLMDLGDIGRIVWGFDSEKGMLTAVPYEIEGQPYTIVFGGGHRLAVFAGEAPLLEYPGSNRNLGYVFRDFSKLIYLGTLELELSESLVKHYEDMTIDQAKDIELHMKGYTVIPLGPNMIFYTTFAPGTHSFYIFRFNLLAGEEKDAPQRRF